MNLLNSMLRVPGYDFSFSDHEAVEVVLDVNLNEDEEEEGHPKKGKRENGEFDNKEKSGKVYQLCKRDGVALKELVEAALVKTRKSQVFHLLLSLLIIPAIFFLSTTCTLPPWLLTTIVIISTSISCFTASLALVTLQQRAVAFANVIERLS